MRVKVWPHHSEIGPPDGRSNAGSCRHGPGRSQLRRGGSCSPGTGQRVLRERCRRLRRCACFQRKGETGRRDAASQHGGEVPCSGRAASRCCVHGFPGRWHRRSLRESSDRTSTRVYARGVATGPSSLVSAGASRRQRTLERGGGSIVSLRENLCDRPTGYWHAMGG